MDDDEPIRSLTREEYETIRASIREVRAAAQKAQAKTSPSQPEKLAATIEEYKQWWNSLPDWIQTVLSLDGQKKDGYVLYLSCNEQLGWKAQVELRDAEIQRIYFWENPKVRRYALCQIKQRKIVVPRVSRESVPEVEQMFKGALTESFKLLEWGWYARRDHALSIEEVAAHVGCKPRQLQKRLEHFGYTKDRLFLDGYWHLEQLEAEEKRQDDQRRQAEHRAKESSEAKARRQLADREHKKQRRAAQKITETTRAAKKIGSESQKNGVTDIREKREGRAKHDLL
jgi:hypothetical protein